MIQNNTLINDLLSENRYWTFWSSDWSQRVNIFWGGKTKFSTITKQMIKQLGKGCGYERQVQLKEPDLSFD